MCCAGKGFVREVAYEKCTSVVYGKLFAQVRLLHCSPMPPCALLLLPPVACCLDCTFTQKLGLWGSVMWGVADLLGRGEMPRLKYRNRASGVCCAMWPCQGACWSVWP